MDPITASALATGGAHLLGGLYSNAQNLGEGKRAREWSAVMAGSAYQRAVIDMKAAGLNPALAYSQGPASTPGASMASVDDVVGPAVSTAMQARAQAKELKLLDAQIEKARQEASSAGAKSQVDIRASQWDARRWQYYFDDQGRPRETFRKILDAEYDATRASSARQMSDAKLAELSIPEREAIARLFESVGGGGKAAQLLLPLLSSLINARR